MLLQFAIGPMCLMVFHTAATYGFISGLSLVLAIALVDATYIAFASLGTASILGRKKVQTAVKLVGCFVMILFGVNVISEAFGLSFLPGITLFSATSDKNLFVQGLLLTASNPLTILFWSSVFSTQIIRHEWDKKQLTLFATGSVMATPIFLTAVAILGSTASNFLPQSVIKVLNVTVGIVLIFFGIRLLCKNENGKRTI
jgi:threonine/homoserine/homoserine lactone efflux protein